MSRTYGGRIFRWKSCGNWHLIPYETLKDDSDEEVVVWLECPNTKSLHRYTRENFERWVGLYYTYLDHVIKPISVERITKNQ